MDTKKIGKKAGYKYKPIEEKETHCWIKGYKEANKIACSCPDTTIVSIADREGDIYEFLSKLPSETNKAYWLIRSSQNRKISRTNNDAQDKLHDLVKKAYPIGILELIVV